MPLPESVASLSVRIFRVTSHFCKIRPNFLVRTFPHSFTGDATRGHRRRLSTYCGQSPSRPQTALHHHLILFFIGLFPAALSTVHLIPSPLMRRKNIQYQHEFGRLSRTWIMPRTAANANTRLSRWRELGWLLSKAAEKDRKQIFDLNKLLATPRKM
jgi:hypothetical protein